MYVYIFYLLYFFREGIQSLSTSFPLSLSSCTNTILPLWNALYLSCLHGYLLFILKNPSLFSSYLKNLPYSNFLNMPFIFKHFHLELIFILQFLIGLEFLKVNNFNLPIFDGTSYSAWCIETLWYMFVLLDKFVVFYWLYNRIK